MVTLVLAVVAGAVVGRWWTGRRRVAASARQMEAALPDAVELVALAVRGGSNVRTALAEAAPFVPAPLAPAVEALVDRLERGGGLDDALDTFDVDTGGVARPFVAAVRSTDRYGTSLVDAVDALVLELRDARRLELDRAARRLPVRLLVPLIVCILPAFVLLTVVPTLLVALRDLGR